MSKLKSRNLEIKQPVYFYKVWEYLTTFGMDEGKNEPYDHKEIFKGKDLLKCRAEAEKYYWKRKQGLEKQGKYFLPFAAPQDFVLGKNAAASLTLSLVEYYTDDNSIEHPIMSGSEDGMVESKEIETAVLKEQGYMVN